MYFYHLWKFLSCDATAKLRRIDHHQHQHHCRLYVKNINERKLAFFPSFFLFPSKTAPLSLLCNFIKISHPPRFSSFSFSFILTFSNENHKSTVDDGEKKKGERIFSNINEVRKQAHFSPFISLHWWFQIIFIAFINSIFRLFWNLYNETFEFFYFREWSNFPFSPLNVCMNMDMYSCLMCVSIIGVIFRSLCWKIENFL